MASIRKFHDGKVKGLMSGLRNIFRQPGDVTTVPEMLASDCAVQHKLPELRRMPAASLCRERDFEDLTVAALVESQRFIARRGARGLPVSEGPGKADQSRFWTNCSNHLFTWHFHVSPRMSFRNVVAYEPLSLHSFGHGCGVRTGR
jgi:hypothetical protein